jgi:hypothetical protein
MAKKEYPPFYEKAIPIAVAVIGLLVIVVLVIALVVLARG